MIELCIRPERWEICSGIDDKQSRQDLHHTLGEGYHRWNNLSAPWQGACFSRRFDTVGVSLAAEYPAFSHCRADSGQLTGVCPFRCGAMTETRTVYSTSHPSGSSASIARPGTQGFCRIIRGGGRPQPPGVSIEEFWLGFQLRSPVTCFLNAAQPQQEVARITQLRRLSAAEIWPNCNRFTLTQNWNAPFPQ